jgi:4-hydroxy-3-polyprenylbenzoate decarboxylase
VDWKTGLHFVTNTTMDTLDYSGGGINEGSKLFVAVSGAPRRTLADSIPQRLLELWPEHWSKPRVVRPGVLAFGGAAYATSDAAQLSLHLEQFTQRLADAGELLAALDEWPLWVLCDDPEFVSANLDNWLWVTFTRDKHWGCRGPLVIDARVKPWHAPTLAVDAEVAQRVDRLMESGSLRGII